MIACKSSVYTLSHDYNNKIYTHVILRYTSVLSIRATTMLSSFYVKQQHSKGCVFFPNVSTILLINPKAKYLVKIYI